MQDPNADTEWNDILRSKGILPPKEVDITEEQMTDLVEQTVKQKMHSEKAIEDMTLDELDALEDEEEERILLQYRQQRLAEMKQFQQKAKFGDVREITAVDYVDEVNKAGNEVWVVLHLYKTGIPLCALVNQHLQLLARKFLTTKFLRSISTTCIPNYPDKNLPTIFIYFEDSMKKQIVGPHAFGGMNLTVEELEWILSEVGAVKTELEEDPRKKRQIRDVMTVALRDSDDEDD